MLQVNVVNVVNRKSLYRNSLLVSDVPSGSAPPPPSPLSLSSSPVSLSGLIYSPHDSVWSERGAAHKQVINDRLNRPERALQMWTFIGESWRGTLLLLIRLWQGPAFAHLSPFPVIVNPKAVHDAVSVLDVPISNMSLWVSSFCFCASPQNVTGLASLTRLWLSHTS